MEFRGLHQAQDDEVGVAVNEKLQGMVPSAKGVMATSVVSSMQGVVKVVSTVTVAVLELWVSVPMPVIPSYGV